MVNTLEAMMDQIVMLPSHRGAYALRSAHVPVCCLEGLDPSSLDVNVDGLALVDIVVRGGTIETIQRSGALNGESFRYPELDLKGKMVLPTFADLHTHIDKGHTCERSRNPDGSLTGADRSTAADAAFWDADDVRRRMHFGVASAYAHGTSALRTHLINMTPAQTALTWPVFAEVREAWRGRVELQGVSLVALSFYRDEEAARNLADLVAAHGGLLGAAVCCAERGGDPADDWTTCEQDRDELLDRIFTLAKERDVDLDFHTDENGNERAKALRYVAQKTIQHGYEGRVVCGHCCSLASQSKEELEHTLELARKARITVVSLPLVNQWTQQRRAGTTPFWRGIPPLHEVRAAGVSLALASDNTRDQFYAYGDLDMLEVLTQGCRMAHLDRPYEDWARSVTCVPAAAMRFEARRCLEEVGPDAAVCAANGSHQASNQYPNGRTLASSLCTLRPGGPADLIVFRGRCYSELMARPQHDRVVIRGGKAINARPPAYELLDDLNMPRGLQVYVEQQRRKIGSDSFEGIKQLTWKNDNHKLLLLDGCVDEGKTAVSKLFHGSLVRRHATCNDRALQDGSDEDDLECPDETTSVSVRKLQLPAPCDAGSWDDVVASITSPFQWAGPWRVLGSLDQSIVSLPGVLILSGSALLAGVAIGLAVSHRR